MMSPRIMVGTRGIEDGIISLYEPQRVRNFTGGWKGSDLEEAESSEKNTALPLTQEVKEC